MSTHVAAHIAPLKIQQEPNSCSSNLEIPECKTVECRELGNYILHKPFQCSVNIFYPQAKANKQRLRQSLIPCLLSAIYMYQRIDFEIDPCTNFYEFACGNYLKEKPDTLPSLYESAAEQAKVEVKRLITEPLEINTPKLQRILKNAYRECMHEGMFKATYTATILP